MRTLDRLYTKHWQKKLNELGQSFQVSLYRNQHSNNYRPSSAMSARSLSNKSLPGQFVKQNDNVFIMSNTSTFVPIKEKSQETAVSEKPTELHN
ncbi:unnamed protein product [Rotaria sp. Silwood2]|nr:unnamed protein product [Rotaria sp. Silwood2]CAF2752198.1 unnamed protein product [Rotaria sp. Silwood2]CAF2998099.1 unnamed protein product [Rotaria sp. Silwood2]CAF3188495.1 unnamed protein product [Rotaria sp. Silwood2]CAF3932936.1 unnamed protein product [Rotaria sp. Silwood2]